MSLLNTRMQNMRENSPNLDKWTNRPGRYGALDVFMRQNQRTDAILSPELLERAAASAGRTLQVPVFDSEAVTIGSTRSVTIADSENTGQLYTVSFTTYAWGFTIVPAMYMNNEIGMQRDFERKFNKYLYKFAATIDSACLTSLSTNKTQVISDNLGYTVTSNVLLSTNELKEEVIGDLTPIMNSNDFYGDFDLIGNTGIQSIINKMGEKSIYNEVNKTIQFADKNIAYTNRLSNDAGHKATGYIVNSGAVGLAYRHEREAILGTMTADGHAWSVDTLPMLGMPIDTYFYESVGDFNAIAGAATADMTRAYKEHYGFAIDVATVTAYNDDLATKSNPILKFAITTA